MTTNGVAMLSDPQPRAHIVYPYTDEAQLIDAVSLFVSCGLRKGEAVLLFVTDKNCDPILKRLHSEGFDLNALQASGQLACENAHQLISTFLFDGIVDELVFKTKIVNSIEKAKGQDGKRPVRVFGEMVSLTWQAHSRATERLEEMWNEIIEAQAVPLLCAYALAGTKPSAFPQTLLTCHSHAVA